MKVNFILILQLTPQKITRYSLWKFAFDVHIPNVYNYVLLINELFIRCSKS